MTPARLSLRTLPAIQHEPSRSRIVNISTSDEHAPTVAAKYTFPAAGGTPSGFTKFHHRQGHPETPKLDHRRAEKNQSSPDYRTIQVLLSIMTIQTLMSILTATEVPNSVTAVLKTQELISISIIQALMPIWTIQALMSIVIIQTWMLTSTINALTSILIVYVPNAIFYGKGSVEPSNVADSYQRHYGDTNHHKQPPYFR